MKKINEILASLDLESVHGKAEGNVTGIYYDSRSVEPKGVFVAITGQYTDGHKFIPQAVEKGSKVVFGEYPYTEISGDPEVYARVKDSRKLLAKISHLFYGKPTEELFVVGITGTNGKTTTAHLTSEVLGADTKLISTLTNKEEPPEEEPVTTPEAPVIQETARKEVRAGRKNLVLEVSSHGLSLERVNWVDFNCGVFTNLTRDHLDFYESMEEYAEEKMKLFTYLSKGDAAILNSDESLSARIENRTEADVIKYGIDEDPDVAAREINRTKEGVVFRLESPWGGKKVELNFPGIYNVYNALAAASVGLVKGFELPDIVSRLERAGRLPGRLDKLELNNGSDVYIDFAHNPGALERALRELQDHYRELFLVFGCGGASDRGKRPEMGKIASNYADRFFITDDNPKGEDRTRILAEIERGVSESARYEVVPERKRAIEKAIAQLNPGKALLVAGKGHERYQITSDEWIEYNDRDFIEELAAKKSLL